MLMASMEKNISSTRTKMNTCGIEAASLLSMLNVICAFLSGPLNTDLPDLFKGCLRERMAQTDARKIFPFGL